MLGCLSAQAQTITETFGSGANQFSIDFVEIGNPGNAADTMGRGGVTYIYNLGKYEVSQDMFSKVGLTFGNVSGDLTQPGFTGPNKPAMKITWNAAALFVNYLNTSKGYQAAYKEGGSLWEAGQQSANSPYRHKDSYYFLPTLDEWWKGAFYDPNKNNGTGGYWKYSTGSDISPTVVSAGTQPGTVVQSVAVPYTYGPPADIQSSGGSSPYGTMAQGGNAPEWTEDKYVDPWRSYRWLVRSGIDRESADLYPHDEYFINTFDFYGFRVAMVPEPSSLSLLLAGGAVLMAGRRRNRETMSPKG